MTITDTQLEELLALARNATPRPWYVRRLDDDVAMSLLAISTVPDTGKGERWPNFDSKEIVAETLVQSRGTCRLQMKNGTRMPPALSLRRAFYLLWSRS